MSCGKCPIPDRCLARAIFCEWAKEDPPDPVKLLTIRNVSSGERAAPSYPSVATQAGNLAGSLWRFVRSGLKLTPRAEVKRRQAVCRTCDKFDPCRRRCTVCGCSTMVKPWLRTAHCPLAKW